MSEEKKVTTEEPKNDSTKKVVDGKTYKTIKVSAKSPVQSLASSIVFSITAGEHVTLRACGASACNQAIKACAVARGTLAAKAKDLTIRPGFDEVLEEGRTKTVMLFMLIVQ